MRKRDYLMRAFNKALKSKNDVEKAIREIDVSMFTKKGIKRIPEVTPIIDKGEYAGIVLGYDTSDPAVHEKGLFKRYEIYAFRDY